MSEDKIWIFNEQAISKKVNTNEFVAFQNIFSELQIACLNPEAISKKEIYCATETHLQEFI
jgi:nucleoside permease NupC